MVGTSARLLRLLTLLQSRGFWSGADLAERLEVTERTVRRDVDRLRSLGYPVISSVGVAGGYQLGAGASLPPLHLDDDEALAVALGLRTVAVGNVVGVEQAALRAMAKLEQVLPKKLRRRIAALHDSVAPMYIDTPRVRPEVLSALAAGCRNHQQASFRYADGRGRTTQRVAQPHGVVHTGLRWYLAAFDEDRDDWRTFRLDRIEGAVSLGGRFTPREVPEGDVASYVSRSVSSDVYRHRARVLIHAPLAEVRARVPPLAGYLRHVDAKRCRLESGADSLSTLAVYIAALGEDFEVEDPPELRRELEALGVRIRRCTGPRGTRTRGARRPTKRG
ncbi:MAG: YafY family protein [Myxococcota bacterium]